MESGFPLGRLDDLLATHVGTHGLRNDDGSVLLLVVLENGDQPTSGGQRTVQRGNGAGAAIFHTFANVQATSLVFGAVGGGGQLAVATLGRNPSFAIEFTCCRRAQIAGSGIDDAVRHLNLAEHLLLMASRCSCSL